MEASILSGVLTDSILHFASKVLQDAEQTKELLQQASNWGPEKVNASLQVPNFLSGLLKKLNVSPEHYAYYIFNNRYYLII
jgi:hypothetical protein